MTKILIPVLLLLSQCTTAQTEAVTQARQGEFIIYDNGLIYDTPTMSKLGKTVDSLNLRFKQCEPKRYYSLEQGYGTYISVDKNINKAREALRKNIPLTEFLSRFPKAEVKRDVWVVKEQYRYGRKPMIEYRSESGGYNNIKVPDEWQFDKTTGWIFEDNGERLYIFYLHDLTSVALPEAYSKMIQYVDCMIDTTTTIFPHVEKPDSLIYDLDSLSKVKAFVDIAMDFESPPGEPVIDINHPDKRKIWDQHYEEVGKWNQRRLEALDEKMEDEDVRRLLEEAVEESIVAQNGMYLDEYAGRYLPPAKALELKRSFRVRGFCSADSGPRDHAKAICKLAAETFQWDIFLRAHLDILNDHFDRNGDGSWAWRGRGTYITELEALDINSVDLLIGTALTSKHLSQNHYSGSNSRVGRALSESKFRPQVEELLLSMTRNSQLDVYNRMEMAYVFIFYNRNLNDKQVYLANLQRIKEAVKTLPGDLYKRYAPLLGD